MHTGYQAPNVEFSLAKNMPDITPATTTFFTNLSFNFVKERRVSANSSLTKFNFHVIGRGSETLIKILNRAKGEGIFS